MTALHDRVLCPRDERPLLLRSLTPQHKHHPRRFGVHDVDDMVGKLFPASSPMGKRLAGPQREHRVEHEDSLPRPRFQTTVPRHTKADICMQLFENILQRPRRLHARAHRETQAVCVARRRVRILAEEQHLHFGVGRERERVENILARRQHGFPHRNFTRQEIIQRPVVGLHGFSRQQRSPRFG